MQYMCLIYDDEKVWQGMSDDERNAVFGEYNAFTESIKSSGNFLAGDALQPTSTATTVRIRNDETLTTDGPFAETKEQLGGYSIVEVGSLDEAVAIARDHPLVRVGGHSIEIRPIRELPPR